MPAAVRAKPTDNKQQAALNLYLKRDQHALHDPFGPEVMERLRGLRSMLTDAPIADVDAYLRSLAAVEADSKSSDAVKRFVLGRLVRQAKEDAALSAKLDARKPTGVSDKSWNKRKQVALRFFLLCKDFPAALAINGVLTFCQQGDWTEILRTCFREQEAAVVSSGLPRPLGTWPSWARDWSSV